MKLILLAILITIGNSSICSVEDEKSFSQKVGELASHVAEAPVRLVKKGLNYVEEHGKGQQAKIQLDCQNKMLQEQMEISKNLTEANKSFAQNNEQCSAEMKEVVETQKERNKILRDIKQDAETAAKFIGAVVGTVTIIRAGYQFFSFVQESVSPSPETKLSQRLVAKNLELLGAEDELNCCLVKNKKGEKEHNGLPRACEVLSDFYAAVAGQEALDKVTHAFSKNNR
ncbi:MAG TPA: hypothetical protein VHO47_01015 [Candidatus Babeliales bacterium]|nr:hypothetical protein [Candidatus Babeliales bacterium]